MTCTLRAECSVMTLEHESLVYFFSVFKDAPCVYVCNEKNLSDGWFKRGGFGSVAY